MSFSVTSNSRYGQTKQWLDTLLRGDIIRVLDRYGKIGVDALAGATPVESGVAASSWSYSIERSGKTWTITWSNSNVENGFPVVIGLQYGHGTGTGGWVEGRDFINPAIQPVFDKIADDVWKVVSS